MNHSATVSTQSSPAVDHLDDREPIRDSEPPRDPDALAPWIYERLRHPPKGMKKFDNRVADLLEARRDLPVSLHIDSVASRLTETFLIARS